MKLIKPINSNYAAIIAKIDNTITLDNCDNVHAAIVLGNHIIVGKDVQKGDIGIYFPLECALSREYMYHNNLYNTSSKNIDPTKKAYFADNGRVRAQNFRGHKSEGLFMPLESVLFTKLDVSEFKIGDEFDTLNNFPICSKYIRVGRSGKPLNNDTKKTTIKNNIIENQFRFHNDTSQFYKHTDKITPQSLIQITYKMHGTSGISSYILCKKKVNWFERLLKKCGIPIIDQEYDYIYSSRRVIKSNHKNPSHYYGEDIWGHANKELMPFLKEGMTFYYEIVGRLIDGKEIQKDYDYGYGDLGNDFGIYIYRITQTSPKGDVYEFSGKQVQLFCKKNGLNAVPEMFYGYAGQLLSEESYGGDAALTDWQADFLETVKQHFNDKPCYMCTKKVPEEGVVIRVEDNIDLEVYKQKSYQFYEYESKNLDKEVVDIEEEN